MKNQRDKYLEEICIIGRTVLMDPFISIIENEAVADITVDYFTLDSVIFFHLRWNILVINFRKILLKKKNFFFPIVLEKSIIVDPIYPFSKLCLEGNIDYPENYICNGF